MVVGAGTMGAGIAFVAAQNGHRVVLVDALPAGLERGRMLVAEMAGAAEKRGLLDSAERTSLEARIRYAGTPIGADAATIIIEAIVEDADAKADLVRTVSAQMGPRTIFASNTSSLSVNALAHHCADSARFAGLHFFNPVPAMKLVEIIPAPTTSPATVEMLVRLVEAWRKVPVVARDVPGFIVNNVARPYYGEAFAALGEGIEPETIDALMTGAGGFRMGPLALADLIGHDINYAVARSIHSERQGLARFRPSPEQAELVENGLLGRKSGRGLYDYVSPRPVAAEAERQHPLETVQAAADCGALEPLLDRLREAGCLVARVDELPSGYLSINSLRLAIGDGRTLAEREDVDVLLDIVRDWITANAIGVTVRTPAGYAVAAMLGARLGVTVHTVPDRPGQIVLRSLAQLANAAADALAEDVASIAHIDAAMRLGANHPEGPCDWTMRHGVDTVEQALVHIARGSDDAIYAPSAGFALLRDVA
ncbi:3-hydroxyacyl-CoA dehydrogenase PaaC [Caenibius tardaugens NBRC 16725]|uniref:3-hydroxyacyl-CoA dehydrogenase PaaC n=2 Tax=Caenibius TaxID=2827482 RepID=U2YAR8_9SPHN|nr:3-hydroxyacyl-CoA dehydrogenase NAD-binding domain-containing protein [Caenibius tardaugens]GAD50526.1 3-hydroxyacyl-CoA dehydrogenase PaaC [Caenibius tardaugens NBRC 16725]